jgi:hypothetical protein
MKKDKRKRPRWLQALIAHLGGYFWLPCPICGENFGGHEWGDESLYIGGGSGWGVCANCGDEARERSDKVHKSEGVVSIDIRKL